MNGASATRLLLGPQRPSSNIRAAMTAAGLPDGPVAVVSAGWQEAEGDLDELAALVQQPLVDLGLYQRAERLFQQDPRLFEAYRSRQDRLVRLQHLYRLRLKHLAVAARGVLAATGDPAMLAAEQRHAIAQLRALDRHLMTRTIAIHAEFDEVFGSDRYPPLADARAYIAETMEGTGAVILTGGNVLVLLNRLRLFGAEQLLATRPVVAWSAGAMVVAERIVLYHDRTPLGRRDPEVLGAGIGLVPDRVFLPDARRRLRETDRARVELLCRRFSPDAVVTLDCAAALRFEGARLAAAEGARRLTRSGRLTRYAAR